MDFLRRLSHDNTRLTKPFDKFDELNIDDFDSDYSDDDDGFQMSSQQSVSTESQMSNSSNGVRKDSGFVSITSQLLKSSDDVPKDSELSNRVRKDSVTLSQPIESNLSNTENIKSLSQPTKQIRQLRVRITKVKLPCTSYCCKE